MICKSKQKQIFSMTFFVCIKVVINNVNQLLFGIVISSFHVHFCKFLCTFFFLFLFLVFTSMHLADAFIQNDLQYIQVILFFIVSMCIS